MRIHFRIRFRIHVRFHFRIHIRFRFCFRFRFRREWPGFIICPEVGPGDRASSSGRRCTATDARRAPLCATAQLPDRRLLSLYWRWAAGGTGLLITGNVMVHAEAMTGPAGVVLDEHAPLKPFSEWAEAGKSGGGAIWMQINHPGRQVTSDMPGVVWGPTDIGVSLGKHSGRFGRPTAMTAQQIQETVARYAVTARRAEEAGFDGVEIHAGVAKPTAPCGR